MRERDPGYCPSHRAGICSERRRRREVAQTSQSLYSCRGRQDGFLSAPGKGHVVGLMPESKASQAEPSTSIPTTLANPTRPGTAPDPRRSHTVASPWITMLSTVRLRCGYGEAGVWPRGQPGRSCWQQPTPVAKGAKCAYSRVLHVLEALNQRRGRHSTRRCGPCAAQDL